MRISVLSFMPVLVMTGLTSSVLATSAQAGQKWVRLECVDVSRTKQAKRFIIDPGQKFTHFRLSVSGADVQLQDLKVRFGNGNRQRFKVRYLMRDGGNTRNIAIGNNGRKLRRIVVRSAIAPYDKRRSDVELCAYGLQLIADNRRDRDRDRADRRDRDRDRDKERIGGIGMIDALKTERESLPIDAGIYWRAGKSGRSTSG